MPPVSSSVSSISVLPFKEEYSFEHRQEEAKKIISKYPDRVPVIVEVVNNKSYFGFGASDNDLPPLDKRKYLVPHDSTVGQFLFTLRRKIKLDEHTAIFMFINGQLPPTAASMIDMWNTHKDADLFLYCSICKEAVFGGN